MWQLKYLVQLLLQRENSLMQVTLWLSQGLRVMLYVVENEIQGKIVSIYS